MVLAEHSCIALHRVGSDVSRHHTDYGRLPIVQVATDLGYPMLQLLRRHRPGNPSIAQEGRPPQRWLGHAADEQFGTSGLDRLGKEGRCRHNSCTGLQRSLKSSHSTGPEAPLCSRPASCLVPPTALPGTPALHVSIPVPTPRTTLPPDSASKVATCFATSTGFRGGSARTQVPSSHLSVIELT